MQTRQENSRYKWVSTDQYIWSEWTFFYSKNIDIRNDLKWIQLLSRYDERNIWNKLVVYVKRDYQTLVRIYSNWDVSIWNNTSFTEIMAWNVWTTNIQSATKFRDRIYVFSPTKILRFQANSVPIWWLTDITPTWRNVSFPFKNNWFATVNFWNSALLVWRWNKLRRGLPTTNTWPVSVWWRKDMRTFDVAEIRWIIGRSSNIEVYTDYNWVDSRIFYIWWFRDAEDTWISNTVVLENKSISQVWQLWERTFIVCNSLNSLYKTSLYEISWYQTRLIKESYINNWNNAYHKDFTFSSAFQRFPATWKMLYLPFYDQVRSFWKELDNIWDNLIWLREWQIFESWICIWDYMYCSSATKEFRYNLKYRHNDYINQEWVLISRIFDWWIMWLRKQLQNIYIWYKLDTTWNPTNAWTITIQVRTNMENYNTDDWRITVVVIDDPTKMREIIETQQIQRAWIDDFSTIQYKVIITPWSSREVSPILYEITFMYDDEIKAIS